LAFSNGFTLTDMMYSKQIQAERMDGDWLNLFML